MSLNFNGKKINKIMLGDKEVMSGGSQIGESNVLYRGVNDNLYLAGFKLNLPKKWSEIKNSIQIIFYQENNGGVFFMNIPKSTKFPTPNLSVKTFGVTNLNNDPLSYLETTTTLNLLESGGNVRIELISNSQPSNFIGNSKMSRVLIIEN